MGADRPVVVYGSGGHGRVVAEVVRSVGRVVLGFVDDGCPAGTRILGLPVLGPRAWLDGSRDAVCVALGIGDNRRREAVASSLEALGFELGVFVHARACVSPTASLGVGTVVMALAAVNAEARIGKGVIVNTGSVIEHECVLGDYSHVSPHAALGGRCSVGARSHVGIGASARQLSIIGSDAVVGAGAVVIRPVLDGATVVGVPARPIR